jgi:hypothetical protein
VSDSHRGHPIQYLGDPHFLYVYCDSFEPVADNPTRPCGHCGLANTSDGHDGCLGTLPGVTNACCGHGQEPSVYVTLADGARFEGAEAVAFISTLRRRA